MMTFYIVTQHMEASSIYQKKLNLIRLVELDNVHSLTHPTRVAFLNEGFHLSIHFYILIVLVDLDEDNFII